MSGNPTITLILTWTLPNKISQTHLWLGRLGIQKHDCWVFCKLRGVRQQGCCSVFADADLLGRWRVAKEETFHRFPMSAGMRISKGEGTRKPKTPEVTLEFPQRTLWIAHLYHSCSLSHTEAPDKEGNSQLQGVSSSRSAVEEERSQLDV